MVEWRNRLWPAAVVALVLHSFIIATLAFGLSYQGARQSALKQDFCVEVAFMPEAEPEATAVPEGDQRIPESSQVKPDQSLEPSRKSVKKILPQKALVKSASMPLDGQKNLQQGLAKGNAMPAHNPPPTYPREARRKKIQGVVLARLSLNPLGSVEKIAILSPRTDPALEEAALRVLPHWRFAPGVRMVDVPIEFRLKE